MHRASVSRFEHFFLILSFLLLSGAFFSTARMLRQIDIPLGGQDPWSTASNFGVYSVALVLCTVHFSRIRPLLSTIWQIPAICAYIVLSIAWSDEPDISARRVGGLILGVAFAYYVASRFSIQRVVLLLAKCFMIIAILSYAAVFFSPETATMGATFDYAWRGVYPTKNVLGQAAVVALLTHIYAVTVLRRERLLQSVFVVLWSYLLFQSDSSTAFIAVFTLAISVLPILTIKTWGRDYLVALHGLAIIFFVAATLLYLNIEDVLSLFHKDLTLTGRTALWSFLLPIIEKRPLFGYGYGGFWNVDNPLAAFIWESLGWQQSQAHNGALELLLQIGIFGTALVFWLVARTLLDALKLLRSKGLPHADYCCFFIIFLVVSSATEYMFLRANDIYWILFTILAIAVANKSRQSSEGGDDSECARYRTPRLNQFPSTKRE
jgi:O-antigen ligase